MPSLREPGANSVWVRPVPAGLTVVGRRAQTTRSRITEEVLVLVSIFPHPPRRAA